MVEMQGTQELVRLLGGPDGPLRAAHGSGMVADSGLLLCGLPRLLLLGRGSLAGLALYRILIDWVTLNHLSRAQAAFWDKVEVGRLTLGPPLPWFDAAGINLGRSVRGQVVLGVDRPLRAQSLFRDHFFLVRVAH